ncbi:hypothetical protein RJ035_008389 [Blastomyces gilchristii]
MDAITSHPLASLFAITAVVSYLNAKFAIGSDLRDIRHARDFARRKQRRVACAKRTHSLYEILEQSGAGDGDDAIWFESKTKSYGQLKKGILVETAPSLFCISCMSSERTEERKNDTSQMGRHEYRLSALRSNICYFLRGRPTRGVAACSQHQDWGCRGGVHDELSRNGRDDSRSLEARCGGKPDQYESSE